MNPTHYDVGLYYGIPFVNTATAGMFNVDLGLNVRIANLKAKVFGPSFAAVGYRYDAIEVDESDLFIDAAFGGFFFGAGVEF